MNGGIQLKKVNITYLGVLLLYCLFTMLLDALKKHTGVNIAGRFFLLVTAAAQLLFILVPVCLCVKSSGMRLKDALLLNRPELLPSLLVILISFPALIVSGYLNSAAIYLLQKNGSLAYSALLIPESVPEFVSYIGAAALFPAVCEELLHRGILLNAYKRFGAAASVIITAVLFGIFHSDPANFVGPVFSGLLLGYYVIRTNSVFPAILAHFANNFITVAMSGINETGSGEISPITYAELGHGFFLCLAALLCIFLLLRVFTHLTSKTASTWDYPSKSIQVLI